MTNPASLLLAQLESWRVPSGNAPREIRLQVLGSDENVMRETQLAMVHLQNIAELLTGMEQDNRRTGPYREMLPMWQKWVLTYPGSWIHATSDPDFDSKHALHVLEGLADAFDQALPQYTEAARADISKTLDDIGTALAEDESLPKPLRLHLYGLLKHAASCLEEYELFGDFELQKALDRLLVAVSASGHVSKDPTKWQKIRDKLMYPVLVGLAIQAPDSVAQIAAILP